MEYLKGFAQQIDSLGYTFHYETILDVSSDRFITSLHATKRGDRNSSKKIYSTPGHGHCNIFLPETAMRSEFEKLIRHINKNECGE